MVSLADRMICDIMMGQWSVAEVAMDDLQFFTRMEFFCFLGIRYFNLGLFEDAISQFSLAIKEKTLNDLEENYPAAEEEEQEGLEELDVPVETETKNN